MAMSLGRLNGKVVVLGGGVSGLAAAWRLCSRIDPSRIVLLEAKDTAGGWIRTETTPNGGRFELGPRSVRPHGKAGISTLDLVSDIGLADQVIPVTPSHEYAKKRFIYAKRQMNALPTPGLSALFKTSPPFERPLFRAGLQDLMCRPARGTGIKFEEPPPDAIMDLSSGESIHAFFARRFGQDVATYGASAMCRGVFAGDSKMLSLRSCFPLLHEVEQKHGSIVWGMMRRKADPVPASAPPIVHRSRKESWRMWTLENGLEDLPRALHKKLCARGVDVRMGTRCEGISMTAKGIQVGIDGEVIEADHVISALPAQQLATVLSPHFSYLKDQLAGILSVTVAIVQMEFDGDVVPEAYKSFGYLVPPCESDWVLGVVLDSCSFPQHNSPDKPNSTRLTVMLGGQWYQQLYANESGVDELFVHHAFKALRNHLDIRNVQPSYINTTVLHDCIPQYYMGHHTRLEGIDAYIRQRQLPISLVGSSYRGVSVNDCILGANSAVDALAFSDSN